MTVEKAIDILKCVAYHELRPDEESIEGAFLTIEEAVKRLIPQKAIKQRKEGGFLASKSGKCPSCNYKYRILSTKRFCPNCGQEIDWGEKE